MVELLRWLHVEYFFQITNYLFGEDFIRNVSLVESLNFVEDELRE